MSEHSEHPAEGAPPPAPGTQPPAASTQPSAPGTQPPAPEGDVIGTAPPAYAGERPPSRWRRWSANAGVRMEAVAIVAGLIGGLVGGGIVAAFDDDGGDHVMPMRVERGVPYGGPGFRGPRYWMPYGGPPGRQNPPNRQPAQPVPTPSPKTTG